MADIHLSRELLRGLLRGELPPRIVVQIGLQHLMGLCPSCRDEIEAFRREQTAGPAADYSRTFEVLPALLEDQMAKLETEQQLARRDLSDLLRMPRAERASRVKRARGRFRAPALVRLLLEESQKQVRQEPEEALHLAELARTVANCNPGMPEFFDLTVLATAHMANACRAGDSPRQAEEHFRHARHVIRQHGVMHPAVLARVDDLEGSLRKDQGLLAKAEELLSRAAMLYRLVNAREDVTRVLINLGTVYDLQGDSQSAIETTRTALDKLPPDADPHLYLCGRFNLACQLYGAGRSQEAEETLQEDADLYQRFADSWTQLRLTWLRGNLADARGQEEPAERAYREARDGFIAEERGYDAALVSMDLAIFYLRQGRTDSVRRLAEEMVPILAAQDVHREALAALVLFQDAARRDELTIEKVREAAASLREGRGQGVGGRERFS
jgi:tetratricopeptide (TPR) repeat protein